MPQRQVSPKQAPRTEGNESQGKMAGKQEKTSLKNVVPTKVYFAKYQMDANREKILDLIPSYLLGRYSKERIDVYGNCIKQELISGEGLSTKKRDMLKALVYIKLFNNKADIRDKARRTLRKIIILEKLQDTYKTKQMDFCVRKFEKYFNDPKNRVIFHLKHVEVIEDMESLCRNKGIKEELIERQRSKYSGQTNVNKIARAIGLALRHNVPAFEIVGILEENPDGFSSFLFHVKKLLSKFIKDGTKIENEVCQACNTKNIIYQEGCKMCLECGWSACG